MHSKVIMGSVDYGRLQDLAWHAIVTNDESTRFDPTFRCCDKHTSLQRQQAGYQSQQASAGAPQLASHHSV
jgi:hypothetical protein